MNNTTNFLTDPLEKSRYQKQTWTPKDWIWESSVERNECQIGFRSSIHLNEMEHTCKHVKGNKKDFHNKSREIFEVKLDIGIPVFLPISLIHICDVINESRRILDLEEDWDQNGAIQINHDTWQSTCLFLIEYSKRTFYRRYNR